MKFQLKQKVYHIDKSSRHHKKKQLLKNTVKVALQYFFNVFILFNLVFNLKFNFKLKIDPKMRTLKNLEEI